MLRFAVDLLNCVDYNVKVSLCLFWMWCCTTLLCTTVMIAVVEKLPSVDCSLDLFVMNLMQSNDCSSFSCNAQSCNCWFSSQCHVTRAVWWFWMFGCVDCSVFSFCSVFNCRYFSSCNVIIALFLPTVLWWLQVFFSSCSVMIVSETVWCFSRCSVMIAGFSATAVCWLQWLSAATV